MPADNFKLPSSSYDEICKIIKGYARHSEPVDLNAVSTVTGINITVISSNTGFLSSAGIITEGKSKQATNLGQRLGLALEHDIPMEVSSAWREVVQITEFLSNMVAAVRIRKGMDIEALQNHIAYSAGAPKNSKTTAGTRAIANILVASGLIREEDGKLVAAKVDSLEGKDSQGPGPSVSVPGHVEKLTINTASFGTDQARTSAGLSVSLDIKLTITVQDLPGLGGQIRRLIEDIQRTPTIAIDQQLAVEDTQSDTSDTPQQD